MTVPMSEESRFEQLLRESKRLHERKSHDYASGENPYANYRFAGEIASLFNHSPHDAGFVSRIAEKIYRLSNLERDGKNPINESIEDTEMDIITITILWMASRQDARAGNPVQMEIPFDEVTENRNQCQERIASITQEDLYALEKRLIDRMLKQSKNVAEDLVAYIEHHYETETKKKAKK